VLVQVHQREARAEVIVVLLQAAEMHFHESEDALQDAARWSTLARILDFVVFLRLASSSTYFLNLGAAAGHILRLRRGLANHIALPLLAAVAPHLVLLAVQ
jgi:hypothetical protein